MMNRDHFQGAGQSCQHPARYKDPSLPRGYPDTGQFRGKCIASGGRYFIAPYRSHQPHLGCETQEQRHQRGQGEIHRCYLP